MILLILHLIAAGCYTNLHNTSTVHNSNHMTIIACSRAGHSRYQEQSLIQLLYYTGQFG